MWFKIWELEFRVASSSGVPAPPGRLGFRVQASGFRLQASEFRVQASGLRAQSSGPIRI